MVEADDFEAEEALLAVLEEARWAESCTDMGRSRHRPHQHCSEHFDLAEAQMELVAHHEVHQ